MPNLITESIGGDDDSPLSFKMPEGFEEQMPGHTLLCRMCWALVPKDMGAAARHRRWHENVGAQGITIDAGEI